MQIECHDYFEMTISDRRVRTNVLVVAACGLFTFACGSQADVHKNSEMKWWMHEYGLQANLLNLLPGQSVEVCAQTDEQRQATIDGIKQWATVIGRWGHFTVKSCGSGANLVVNVQGSSVTGQNWFMSNPGSILVLFSASGDFLKAILLHEMGHSWGLCDQYTDAGTAACSTVRSPTQNNYEVMGVTSPDKLLLTQGDASGIQAVTRLESPSNNAWRRFLRAQK
jgi:hypothetical protein